MNNAIDICQAHYGEFTLQDFSFILETIQDGPTSQEQFWESMTMLIRISLPPTTQGPIHAQRHEWRKMVAFAMVEVYLSQDQSVFVKQVERVWNRSSSSQESPSSEPFTSDHGFTSDHEILAHTMIESLDLTFYRKRAFGLYKVLSESGIGMPVRLLASFIRIAAADNDSNQLERIGNMLLRHEEMYQESLSSPSPAARPYNRPTLLTHAKLMDSFVVGACANELYGLARAVFDKGLEAAGKFKVETFTTILNSYSVKGLDFDIVSYAVQENEERRRWLSRRTRPDNHGGKAGTTTVVSNASDRKITMATPEEIEKYISAMEQQGVYPTISTLNTLVKLYLEMALHKVVDAPRWIAAFRRYNPLKLEPDVVTNNTLLAYYGKNRDLATMKKIYDDMARTDNGGPSSAMSPRKRREIRVEQSLPTDGDAGWLDSTTEYSHEDQSPWIENVERRKEQVQDDRHVRSPSSHPLRSSRDHYTYNIMLHALLKHAARTNDIITIGQCFHDMEQDGISVDTVTFNSNILYHISRKDLASAMQVFRGMNGADNSGTNKSRKASAKSSKPTKSTRSSVALARTMMAPIDSDNTINSDQHRLLDRPATAASTLDTPPAPDIVTLTSLISGFGRMGQMDEVTHIFREMTDRLGINPNLKTYSALVAGLHRAGDHERAERLWDIVRGGDERNGGGSTKDIDTRRAEEVEIVQQDEMEEEHLQQQRGLSSTTRR